MGKGVGGVTNTAGNAGKRFCILPLGFILPGLTLDATSFCLLLFGIASLQTCSAIVHYHSNSLKLALNIFLLRTHNPVSDNIPTVGGLGNVLGDTLKGTTGTLGDATKGVGNVAKDTTGGVGDTARSATGAKQDAQNPLGLSE